MSRTNANALKAYRTEESQCKHAQIKADLQNNVFWYTEILSMQSWFLTVESEADYYIITETWRRDFCGHVDFCCHYFCGVKFETLYLYLLSFKTPYSLWPSVKDLPLWMFLNQQYLTTPDSKDLHYSFFPSYYDLGLFPLSILLASHHL